MMNSFRLITDCVELPDGAKAIMLTEVTSGKTSTTPVEVYRNGARVVYSSDVDGRPYVASEFRGRME